MDLINGVSRLINSIWESLKNSKVYFSIQRCIVIDVHSITMIRKMQMLLEYENMFGSFVERCCRCNLLVVI